MSVAPLGCSPVVTDDCSSLMSSWCDAPLAILTSGQAARFTYKAQFAFVRGRSGRSSLQQLLVDRSHHPPCVPTLVDAFIVLSDGARASVWTNDGAFSSTTLANGVEEAGGDSDESARHAEGRLDLKKVSAFYSSLGVRNVRISLIGAALLANMTAALERDVAAIGAQAVSSTPNRWWTAAQSSIPRWRLRWRPHARMLTLRHLAFRAALDEGVPYRYYLYLREDNAFLEPPTQLASTFASNRSRAVAAKVAEMSAPGGGVVAVDELCGWGSWSDKIYLADRPGAAVLFAETRSQHVRRLAQWVQLGMLPPDAPQRLRPLPSSVGWIGSGGGDEHDGEHGSSTRTRTQGDPMQTEYFLQSALMAAGTDVHPFAFHRTDVRRLPSPSRSLGGREEEEEEEERVCVPDLYWSCRARGHTKALSRCHDRLGNDRGVLPSNESSASSRVPGTIVPPTTRQTRRPRATASTPGPSGPSSAPAAEEEDTHPFTTPSAMGPADAEARRARPLSSFLSLLLSMTVLVGFCHTLFNRVLSERTAVWKSRAIRAVLHQLNQR